MNINLYFKKIYNKILINRGRFLKHKANKVEKYISKFPEPIDDIQRSYFQYKCQKWDTMSIYESIIANAISFFLIIPKIFQYKKNISEYEKKVDAVLTMDWIKNYLPDDFFGTCAIQDFYEGSLTNDDLKFIRNLLKRYPLSFYFSYKSICRIASYSDAIRKYKPSVIFSSCEYSFTSSILTKYCEMNNVKHYNVMHGEKLYNPREAFFRFSRFYVYDVYYIQLFHFLRNSNTEYLVNKMNVPLDGCAISNVGYCKYYLQLHTKRQLEIIKDSLAKTGLFYSVRLHPLYSSGKEKDIFGEKKIEDCKVDIWSSLKNAGMVIAIDSTVLYQAYLLGIPVVIDDVSDRKYFEELKDRKYIMLSKPHILLSELISKN